ncbi:filamentous hemagglutinin N-terminal domain-containing protein [Tolypothrix bouteillei VB521301_2]|uniref:two-partner secretion domain-containing protein n=1 Tax=Tolypothrix bouteillei TaxID=1246981 RepID=UPI0038B4F045
MVNGWHLKSWFLIGGVLSVLYYAQPSSSQVIPDNTLPVAERTQVTGAPDFQIDGGARRGDNLFHSFQSFSIPTGGSAYFNNSADIQNILTRVTGGSVSNIDGLIRTNGTANLFLLNPNGIVFGPNASLNIGGSFLATTANAIGWENDEVFSSDAAQPLPSQLLNVNANALFFNQLSAQAIINRSTANNTGLQVPSGQNLVLVGGDVRLENGRITSPASRVELGAVAGQGKVGLSGTAGNWQLNFPASVQRSDVSLSNSSTIDVRGGGGGSIAVTALNLNQTEGSRLFVGIKGGLGFTGASAGNITIDATGTVTLKDVSLIVNFIDSEATGDAGNINILADSLYLIDGSQLFASTFGNGNAGSVNINARELVSFDGVGDTGYSLVSSGVFSSVGEGAVGNGSTINIETGSLSVRGGAGLFASTYGKGNAGSVNINARELVSFDGGTSSGDASGAFSSVAQPGVGNAGDININAKSLSLTGGAGLFALTEGTGDAGNIKVNVAEANFSGVSEFGLASGMVTSTTDTAEGQGGNITINASNLSIRDGAVSSARTYNEWNGGNVIVNVDTLELTSGGKLLTTAYSSGQAGNTIINARS